MPCLRPPTSAPHSLFRAKKSPPGWSPHSVTCVYGGFALVAVLAVLTLVLVLVLAISAVVHVETRTSASGKNMLLARQNALLGLDTALAQLQEYAGKDTAVTFPATTYFPRKNPTNASGPLFDDPVFGYRAKAATAAKNTYLRPPEREQWDAALRTWWNAGRNPWWTGIADASLRRDNIPEGKFGEPKRGQLPVWLVSGNERFRITGNMTEYPEGYLTPEDILPAPNDSNDVIWLVGEGSATDATSSADGLDGRVKVRKMALRNSDATPVTGHYAYWVGDESLKANFAVRDPWFEETNVASPNYRNRLQTPQRLGWETIKANAAGNSTFASLASFSVNDPNLENISTSSEIGLVEAVASGNPEKSRDIREATRRNFHSLTAWSRSLLTDTALGGLKKDLTPLLHGTGAGYNLSAPIADPSRYSNTDPRFSPGGGFPASTTNLPTWGDLRAWAQSSAGGGAISPAPGLAPVLVNYRLFFALTHQNGRLQMHFVPFFALWNPLDTPLQTTTYTLRFRHNFQLWRFGVATNNMTDPTPTNVNDGQYWPNSAATPGPGIFYLHQLEPVDWFDRRAGNFKRFGMGGNVESFINDSLALNPPVSGGNLRYRMAPFDNFPSGNPNTNPPLPSSSNMTYVNYQFTSGFAPGEVRVFMVQGHQQIAASQLHNGTPVILQNDYDPDFPGSVYFDFARFRDVDGTGTTLPTPASETVFYGEMLLPTNDGINTPMFNSAELLAGNTVLWRAETLGTHPNWGANLQLQFTPLQISNNTPANWRRVYHFDDWVTRPKSGTTGTRTSPLVGMYRAFLEPLSVPAWRIFQDSRLRIDGASKYFRAFANYNLLSSVFTLHPQFERSRAVDPANNSDRYATISPLQTVTDATANPATFIRWDANQADLSSGVARGYALMTSRSADSLGTTGLSILPLRQFGRPPGDVLSLGRLQQANLSPLAWQPTFAVGNSEASPYVDRDKISGLQSYPVGSATSAQHVAVPQWRLPEGQRLNGAENFTLDLSFLLNENLWDSYFLSSIPQSGAIPTDNSVPLPNSRHRFTRTGASLSAADLRNPEIAAAGLENFGALNINSTSVQAWKALLASFRDLAFAQSDTRSAVERATSIPVSRSLDPQGGPLQFTFATQSNNDVGAEPVDKRNYRKFFDGFRYLTDDMIDALAKRIVDEIRLRGPFYSLGDFVNRRLVAPQGVASTSSAWYLTRVRNQSGNTGDSVHSYGIPATFYGGGYSDTILSDYDPLPGLSGLNGAVQRALNLSGINGGLNFPTNLPTNNRSFRVELNPRNLAANPQTTGNQPMQIHPHGGHYLDTEHLAGAPTGEVGQLLSHSPGFVTQADILAMIGPALTPRGDTFLIRSYGDAVDQSGRIVARAYVEAVVQRVVEPVTAKGNSGADRWTPADRFGRRFQILSLRWLTPEEI